MAPKMSDHYKQKRRKDILEAAEKIFIEKGYEHTTIKDIYEEVGLSRGGVYQYFSNKRDLFESLIGDKLEDIYQLTADALEDGEDPWTLLKKRMFGEEQHPSEYNDSLAPVVLEFFVSGRTDESLSVYARDRYHLGVSMYENIIQQGESQGIFTPRFSPGTIARAIISFSDGIAVDSALAGEEVQSKEQSELLFDMIQYMLGIR
ncbi:TetR/AcrR family transcriptional regulator [Salimicrobium halophilum]|uniref:DNA-binding transcriptional regulator, AcrR family n=1 Tax=Salimicrobium halophilum TaxID=86666 RepID=A0A1G8R0S0_9BACI|nr:TetR/AcrR family transcriptional regulator [Salimicrobium halophilum]SDJ10538.1 DNA-binding transcriptional regulator, AcrR family [Salimicrobium halophilum]